VGKTKKKLQITRKEEKIAATFSIWGISLLTINLHYSFQSVEFKLFNRHRGPYFPAGTIITLTLWG